MAAVGAAGIATSMAQVYSVNAVGYVNKTIPAKGFALISNPLKAATNTINAVLQPVPAGFQVYVYTPGKGYAVGTYDDLSGAFLPDAVGNTTITPGQGVFVQNTGSSAVTITFVGEVPQGTLTTALVAGLQIVSSQVPQAGKPSADLGLPGADGDQYYVWDSTGQKYNVATYDGLGNAWLPQEYSIDVGDALFVKKVAAATWTRTFNVNG